MKNLLFLSAVFISFISMKASAVQTTEVTGKILVQNGKSMVSQNWFDSENFGYIQVILGDLTILPSTFSWNANLEKAKAIDLVFRVIPSNCKLGSFKGSLNPRTSSPIVIRLDGQGCKYLFNDKTLNQTVTNMAIDFDRVPADSTYLDELILRIEN